MSTAPSFTPPTVWDRVVCAVDGSPESQAAAVTAAGLMPPAAKLTMCTVRDPQAGEDANARDKAVEQAQSAVQAAHDVEPHLREGRPIERILDELHTEHATLLTLGASERASSTDMLLGPVTCASLHDAQASILIAHAEPAASGEIVVGFDGSGGARRALAAAQELSDRPSLGLRVIVAGGHSATVGALREDLAPGLDVTEDPRGAVEALTDASRAARLLALGSRHLQGVLTRSSISEQTAHLARCPVLVMR